MPRRYTEAVIGLPGTRVPEGMRDLLDLLNTGGIVVTANARAARALHRRHAEAASADGATAWRTPQILDLESWLAEQWHTLLLAGAEDRLLLNNAQEQAVWERIVSPTLAGRSLIAPARMTDLAQQAYALLAAHSALARLNDAAWSSDPHAEGELFRQWARAFREECRRRRWLPHCELSHAVAAGLRNGTIQAPQRVGWLGFDRHTPAQLALLEALASAGSEHQTLPTNQEECEPTLLAAASESEQAAACAEWARAQLAARPSARIGILAPELSAIRPQLERALFRALAPDRFSITADAVALPFEFAVGMPLAETPLVRAALLLLRWLEEPLAQQDVTWLLLSSALGPLQPAAAREAAARWDADLRNAPGAPPEMALDSLLRHPGASAPAIAPAREQLYAMAQTYRREHRRASATVWVQRIDELLRLAGWGEVANASSLVYQVRQAWDALLETIASLDFEERSFTFSEIRTALERMARETIFAPESEDAPVQVMSALAAAGQSFDAVWFLSASEAQWPAAGRPHPLLPLSLQRQLAMPHATPAIDTELAHRVTTRVLASAPEVVFSYAAQGAEAVLQQPSPLTRGMRLRERVPTAAEVVVQPLEQVADDTWVPHPAAAAAGGGQRVLKQQADCPFQAFAYQRLQVRELPIAERGLSPRVRGNLLHTVLELVWSKDTPDHAHVEDSATLRASITSGRLRPLVEAHAAQAFAREQLDRSQAWQRAYLAAEQRRLVDLVMEWLQYEDSRQQFRVVAVEQKIDIQLGELALSVRGDRIDEVATGHILLDYKTGEVSAASWEGPRPEEPQLPLYAAFGNVQSLAGALFAQVRPGKLCFKGRVQSAHSTLMGSLTATNPLVKSPYSEHLLEEWRATLTALAESFVRGEAQVDPRDYPTTCRYCALPGLCRVAELSRASAEAPDEEEEPA